MVGRVAAGLGHTLRWSFLLLRAMLGPALVIYGVSMFSLGAAVVVGGLLIIWLNTTPREDAK